MCPAFAAAFLTALRLFFAWAVGVFASGHERNMSVQAGLAPAGLPALRHNEGQLCQT